MRRTRTHSRSERLFGIVAEAIQTIQSTVDRLHDFLVLRPKKERELLRVFAGYLTMACYCRTLSLEEGRHSL